MATVLITGGTGMIGSAVSAALRERGYDVLVLTRNPAKYQAAERLKYVKWDIEKDELDPKALEHTDHIIHLAGEGIADKRWTKERKKEIRDSRVKPGQLLVSHLSRVRHQVKTIVSASAIGYYGEDKGGKIFEEDDLPAPGFLGDTSVAWENSVKPVEALGIRLIQFRIGIVLSNRGGALKEFLRPVKFGLATILGNGKQVISWIHIDDLVRIFMYALENTALTGVYNAVAPEPVTNRELMTGIGRAWKGNRFIAVHVPAPLLKLALGEMSIEVLKSTTVSSRKIEEAGFIFQYPRIGSALQSLAEPNPVQAGS